MLEIVKKTMYSLLGSQYVGELRYTKGQMIERFQLFYSTPNFLVQFLLGRDYCIITPYELEHLEMFIRKANRNELMFSHYKFYKKMLPAMLHLFCVRHVTWNRSESLLFLLQSSNPLSMSREDLIRYNNIVPLVDFIPFAQLFNRNYGKN